MITYHIKIRRTSKIENDKRGNINLVLKTNLKFDDVYKLINYILVEFKDYLLYHDHHFLFESQLQKNTHVIQINRYTGKNTYDKNKSFCFKEDMYSLDELKARIQYWVNE